MITSRHKTALLLVAALAPVTATFTSCRGEISKKPPIHINPNMDWQPRLKAQSESEFENWTDKRGMRLPVRGTVARGHLRALDPDPDVAKFHVYKKGDGTHVTANPLPKTKENILRGKERYMINCSMCHGLNGRGVGLVGLKMPVRPPSLVKKATDDHPKTRHEQDRVIPMPDGQMFDVITNGKGAMNPYKYQVSAKDRWAIIHYLRVLQLRAASN